MKKMTDNAMRNTNGGAYLKCYRCSKRFYYNDLNRLAKCVAEVKLFSHKLEHKVKPFKYV